MHPVPVVVAVCVAASFTLAQENMDPAPELKKLARIAGEFVGSGTSKMSPDAPESKWTGVHSARWILNGHFLQEDVRIEFGAGAPAPLLMRAVVGFDREHKRYVSYGVSNMHPPSSTEPMFVGDDTIVTNRSGVAPDGTPVVGRGVTKLTDNGYTFEIEQAMGSGPMAVKVKGAFQRRSAQAGARDSGAAEAAFASGKPSEEMARLGVLLGKWRAKGKMVPPFDSPPVDISGTNDFAMILGGAALACHIQGDPQPAGPAFEAWFYQAWNARNACYDTFWIDNMGMCSHSEARFTGKNEMVTTTGSTLLFGKPVAMRSVLVLADDGKSFKTFDDHLLGTAASVRAFAATFTKVER